MTIGSSRRRRAWGALLAGLAVPLLSLSLPAAPASAHPLDVYLQATYLTLSPTSVGVEIDLSPGVLLAPRVLEDLDENGDRHVSTSEARTYLGKVVSEARVSVDGRPLALRMTKVDVPPYLTLRAGYGTMRVQASTPRTATQATGEHRVFFRNGFSDPKATYQVNAFVAEGAPVVLGSQRRDPTQRQATVSYRVGAATPGTTGSAGTQTAAAAPVRAAAPGSGLAGYLQDSSLSVWAVVVALGAASLLGALHALTPGHAKTLIAAYLIGNQGTARNAVTLGAVVTLTHTASVILIGLLALFASQFLLPEVLVPLLEAVSGALVVGLGLRLLRQRWPRRRAVSAASPTPSTTLVLSGTGGRYGDHVHPNPRSHPEPHQHGGRAHTHALPAEGVTLRSLVAMGVSGGLVPCPEALGVMVVAVGVDRTVLGLGLIVSFSLGLAAVLIGLGLVLVRSRTVLARLNRIPAGWTTALPLVSAVIVTVLGTALLLRALTGSSLGIP